MPANLNPRVVELLSWHGHAKGGVHVPFQASSNPIGRTIETSLVLRLRKLAIDIANNAVSSPRWIFLIGGPGNGKSETVQDFLSHLDSALGLGGALNNVLSQRFSPSGGLVPRKVEVLPADLGAAGAAFAAKIGRLMVVQDATATESAHGNAANELAIDLADLITTPNTPPMPVFIACANRGLLARAMNEAYRAFGNDVTRLFANLIQASSLGRDTLEGRKPCWPIETDSRFACWPLDVESLLVGSSPPLDQALLSAIDMNSWETAGRCGDCTARDLCPFRQNAEWLRSDNTRRDLLSILRRGELARGQRWNFRDAFSLIAELVVGQWSDFSGATQPCKWVHGKVATLQATPPDTEAIVSLALGLYPHAMFRGGSTRKAASVFLEHRAISLQSQPVSFRALQAISADGQGESTKPIREIITRDYARLDPATFTPSESGHPLRLIEDAFCQSVEQGRSTARQQLIPAKAEDLLLEVFEKAESEWDLLGRESAVAVAAVCLIRNIAGMMTKRSVGVRLGFHALEDLLSEYEACLRDNTRLRAVSTALQPLLGNPVFKFNLLEILGQPTADEIEPLVALQGPTTGAQALAAPQATDAAPGHDMPSIRVTDPSYRIPLTFDFYMALQLRKKGCAASSLPASVRAALDRVRHRYAGELCRKEDLFVDGRTFVLLADDKKVSISTPGAVPGLVPD